MVGLNDEIWGMMGFGGGIWENEGGCMVVVKNGWAIYCVWGG